MTPDPVGDSLPATTGYLDTAAYGVSSVRSKFSFVFAVAQAIPASFTVPMDFDAAQYSFCLETVSEGKNWTGTLIDRRPLVEGGDAKTPAIPFIIDDSRTRGWFTVPSASLGDPETFEWAMSASLLMLPLPSDDFIDLDANYERMIQFTA